MDAGVKSTLVYNRLFKLFPWSQLIKQNGVCQLDWIQVLWFRMRRKFIEHLLWIYWLLDYLWLKNTLVVLFFFLFWFLLIKPWVTFWVLINIIYLLFYFSFFFFFLVWMVWKLLVLFLQSCLLFNQFSLSTLHFCVNSPIASPSCIILVPFVWNDRQIKVFSSPVFSFSFFFFKKKLD